MYKYYYTCQCKVFYVLKKGWLLLWSRCCSLCGDRPNEVIVITLYEDQRTQRLVVLSYGKRVFALAMDLESELMTRRIG